METGPDDAPDVAPRPFPELAADAERASELRQACDYAAVGRLLPRLLRELHAAVQDAATRTDALRAIVMACQAGALMLKNLGHPDLAWIIAERGREAADRLDHPVWRAAAQFPLAHALLVAGATTQALAQVDRAAASLGPSMDDPDAAQVYGMLHLTAALALTELRRPDDAADRLAEAEAIAGRTGDGTAFRFCFGPTNVKLWQVSLAVEEGEGAKAAEIASTVDVDAIPVRSREAAFFADVGRGLAQVKGRSREAVALLHRAEKLAPQRIRTHPLVRETVRDMLEQTRRQAGGQELHGLARRMNVLPE
jgi:hypothetical protein